MFIALNLLIPSIQESYILNCILGYSLLHDLGNFELWREVEDEVEAKKKKKEDEEENNAMKALENRTKQSKKEMDMLDTLEEIRDMNDRNAAVDVNELIQQKNDALVKELQDQEKRDEEEIAKIFNSTGAGDDTSATDGAADNIVVPAVPVKVKRLAESDSDEGQSNVRKRPVFGQSDNPKTKKAKPGLAIHTITDHSELDIIPEIVTVSASTNAPRSKESVMKKKFNLGAMLGIVRKSEKPEAAVVKKSEKPEAAVSNVLAGLGGYGSSSEDSS
ncbi:hypothetical protein SARC_00935 [Sphaeroforma arctica JP610]|uniref:Uncharacterized protein n=1 Tax=Sphaeroforma arctica JP610 TaxID=667725 RepID=A0A0L0GF54_9EUKA|nr:hypothetical protein SARC_00935 [Sphaeroforma arctica JP610]KNC86933.1 hypothetical protein SARC_00935 [Sphaeroforma arctica JP610]|eukprot:XP_014160835.1 hypothetical protein SARC_00935 [Sphaeroforma arctica JP610]